MHGNTYQQPKIVPLLACKRQPTHNAFVIDPKVHSATTAVVPHRNIGKERQRGRDKEGSEQKNSNAEHGNQMTRCCAPGVEKRDRVAENVSGMQALLELTVQILIHSIRGTQPTKQRTVESRTSVPTTHATPATAITPTSSNGTSSPSRYLYHRHQKRRQYRSDRESSTKHSPRRKNERAYPSNHTHT